MCLVGKHCSAPADRWIAIDCWPVVVVTQSADLVTVLLIDRKVSTVAVHIVVVVGQSSQRTIAEDQVAVYLSRHSVAFDCKPTMRSMRDSGCRLIAVVLSIDLDHRRGQLGRRLAFAGHHRRLAAVGTFGWPTFADRPLDTYIAYSKESQMMAAYSIGLG